MTSQYSIPIIYPRIVDLRDFNGSNLVQGPSAIMMVNPQALVPTTIATATPNGDAANITAFRALAGMANAGYLTIIIRGTDKLGAVGVFYNLIPLLDNVNA